MTHALKSALFAALFASTAHAQSASPAYGHWEGAIESPLGAQAFTLDLGPGADGKPAAELGIAAEDIAGLPLRRVSIDGAKVAFELPGDGGKFTGDVDATGKVLTGLLEKPFGSATFSLQRTGDTRFAAAPVTARIPKRYEGEWTGALANTRPIRISLTNTTKGGAARFILDEETSFPLNFAEAGDTLTLALASTGEKLNLTLSKDGVLAGDYIAKSGARTPVSLKRKS